VLEQGIVGISSVGVALDTRLVEMATQKHKMSALGVSESDEGKPTS
jgi:hypothetical protein